MSDLVDKGIVIEKKMAELFFDAAPRLPAKQIGKLERSSVGGVIRIKAEGARERGRDRKKIRADIDQTRQKLLLGLQALLINHHGVEKRAGEPMRGPTRKFHVAGQFSGDGRSFRELIPVKKLFWVPPTVKSE